ncbi:glycosyltransferase family 4 protein [Polynucleobacter paneuropaeus]|nr:glycosyltransferase family 4 protein [Polynucleobacter paneuropaeus]
MLVKLFIYAPSVYQGGGLRQLLDLLSSKNLHPDTCLILNSKVPKENIPDKYSHIIWANSGYMARFISDINLFLKVDKGSVVLCFGNLPPLLPLTNCYVAVFLQNRFLVDELPKVKFSTKFKIKCFLLKRIFYLLSSRINEVVVQSESMNLLLNKFPHKFFIRVAPFMKPIILTSSSIPVKLHSSDTKSFIYPASGDPHKNHQLLFTAWLELAKAKIFPILYVTLPVDHFENLMHKVFGRGLAGIDVRIYNLGNLSHEDLISIYTQIDAMIFPSLFESFGLPLVEARQLGIPILSSELDYVHDVCTPAFTFDPCSPRSIARAVKKILRIVDHKSQIFSEDDFILELQKQAEDVGLK